MSNPPITICNCDKLVIGPFLLYRARRPRVMVNAYSTGHTPIRYAVDNASSNSYNICLL